MKLLPVVLFCFALGTSALGQTSTKNPVDELKEQVTQILKDAQVPFTEEQDKQLALVLEEERQASENLFGEIWDFSKGPPQGEQRDRALAGIQWMHDEFKKKLPTYMTDSQRAAWEKYEVDTPAVGASIESSNAAQANKIQQIRVTNNAFNVESGDSGRGGPTGGGAKTEVIERGGAGAFHGNFSSTFQDDMLNARNPFANNKPPYYERTIDGNISGPIIRDRLSLNFTLNDNKQENVSTVKAVVFDGPYSLGVTKPTLNRYYDTKAVLQLADSHSMNMSYRYSTNASKNQNVGNFTLPERASETHGFNHYFDIREISILSERTVHDLRFVWRQDHSERTPASNAVAITVTDAFNGGGAQGKSLTDGNNYELSNLIYYAGEKLTMRSGFQSWFRHEKSVTEDNFFGEFTFADIDSYRKVIACNCTDFAKPQKFKITRGDPFLDMKQVQLEFFTQNDWKFTKTFSMMFGLKYSVQTNIDDKNNWDPRVGFAYAIGNSTVLRGGIGIFHNWVGDNNVQTALRLNGKRQFEVQVDNPGWPDPYTSGDIKTITPSSRRILDPDLAAQYYLTEQITLERSLPKNLFVTASYDVNRGIHLIRLRDLNAPLPGSGLRPLPEEGQIIQYQGTGLSTHKNFKVSMRQRFSIFNITGSYIYYKGVNDEGSGSSPAMPTNSYNLNDDWGNPGFQPTHTFNSSVNSRLPMNVYLTTSISARSGSFYTITTGKDDNKDGVINDRPAGVAKNSEVGPHYFNVSFNFSKAVQLARPDGPTAGAGGGMNVNFFANLNNAFNMTHWGTPSGVMTSPFFKKSFNASSPREIEAGIRFQFCMEWGQARVSPDWRGCPVS